MYEPKRVEDFLRKLGEPTCYKNYSRTKRKCRKCDMKDKWKADEDLILIGEEEEVIGEFNNREQALRAATCVNACISLDPDALDSGIVEDMVGFLEALLGTDFEPPAYMRDQYHVIQCMLAKEVGK